MRRESTRVVCGFGHQFETSVYRSANVTRAPELRQAIVSGQFNLTICPVCANESYADVPFLYHDTETSLRVWVYPDRNRHAREEILAKIRRAAVIVNTVLPTDRSGPELIFGLDELRDLIA
ncbi:MAG: hypothetical protein EPO26_02230 [Chloroflexota bacterium]|nr:MAG: hypothetical protein EPO26_02230 [Chloroflexota bacterium]